jgi:hypothetical protein
VWLWKVSGSEISAHIRTCPAPSLWISKVRQTIGPPLARDAAGSDRRRPRGRQADLSSRISGSVEPGGFEIADELLEFAGGPSRARVPTCLGARLRILGRTIRKGAPFGTPWQDLSSRTGTS